MKNFLKIFSIVLALIAFFGCEKKEEKSKVYVGMNADFAPFEYREGKNIVGFDVDLMREIAKISGIEVEFMDIQFDGLLPALELGKIDMIISGMTVTENRKKFVNFSDSYFNSTQVILVNSENQNIGNFSDLSGKVVGVALGFTGDLVVSKLPNVSVQKFNTASDLILALKSRKVEAVVLDYETAKNYAAHNQDLKLIQSDAANEEYAIAMRKDEVELLQKVNEALKKIKENGTYDTLIAKYFG